MSQMAQPSSISSSSSSSDVDLLQQTVKTTLAQIEKHAPDKDKALLRAMLEYAPSDKGKFSIAGHILGATDASKLDQLADLYWVNIILAIRSAAGKTPTLSLNPSQGECHGGETPFNIEHAKKNQEYLKKHTLARDDYCCLVTRRIDSKVFIYKPGFVRPPSGMMDIMEARHIIPISLNNIDDKDEGSVQQKTRTWTTLQAFCGNDISALRGVGINSIDNVMTLSDLAHQYFSELQLAFEAVPNVPGKYKLVTFGKDAPIIGFPETVTLKSATGQPLPNPFYLAIHCAICKVLWASGQAEALEQAFCELEDTSVLAEDGGSAEVLKLALQLSITA